jgi:hypothetical protein
MLRRVIKTTMLAANVRRGRNVHRSLQRIDTLSELIERDACVPASPGRRKLARTLNELHDYLESNRDLIPDYGDRRRHGEAIASSIAESTVNQVISRRRRCSRSASPA